MHTFSTRLLTRLHASEEQARRVAVQASVVLPALTSQGADAPQVSALVRDAALLDVAVAAETLRFDTLSNSQFIENVSSLSGGLFRV